MSTLKVGGIRGTGASADAITLNATDGTCTAKITNKLSNRNKIINGGMIINQRGNVTGKTSSSNEYWGPDRYQAKMSSSAAGTWSVSQETDAPEGFSNSLLWHCTSGVTMATNKNVYIRHKIEAQNLVDWKWGTSNAKEVLLSFYVKSTETGVGTISAFHSDHATSDANTGYTYTINSASTWERKTIQIVKSTTDAFDVNNSTGLSLYFNLDGGPDLKTGTLNTSWGAWNEANWMPGQTIAMAGTGKKYWITGIQLEAVPAGQTTPTDFEHRSYGDELLRCQRYCRVYGGHAAYQRIGIGYFSNTTRLECPLTLAPQMRTTPTMTVSDAGDWKAESPSGSGEFTAVGLDGNSSNQVAIVWGDKSSSFTAGESGRYLADNTTNARIYLAAEL